MNKIKLSNIIVCLSSINLICLISFLLLNFMRNGPLNYLLPYILIIASFFIFVHYLFIKLFTKDKKNLSTDLSKCKKVPINKSLFTNKLLFALNAIIVIPFFLLMLFISQYA